MPVFRKITASSTVSSYKGAYEYMLIWYSVSCGFRQWCFSSTFGIQTTNYKGVLIDNKQDYRGVPNEQEITIEMFTRAVSRQEFDYISSIFESNRVLMFDRLDMITIPVAIDRAKKRVDRIQKDFEIKFDINLQEPDLLNV